MEREHAHLPRVTVEVPGLGPVTLVANGGGYHAHSGDGPNGGPRPVWTINTVTYTGSVHVGVPDDGEPWAVSFRGNSLSRHPYSNTDATDAAYRKAEKILTEYLTEFSASEQGVAHLRAGCAASANNDAMRLSEQLAKIHDHHKNIRTAHELAEARCAALDAGEVDPGRVDHPETPRSL